MNTTTIAAIDGTRLRTGYPSASVEPGGTHAWRQFRLAVLADSGMNNCTGVSEVEYRLR